MSERTENGIRVGAIEVSALAEWSRGSAIRVSTPYRAFDVSATPKGRDVHVEMPTEAERPGYQRLEIIAPNGDEVTIHGSDKYGWFVAVYRDGRWINDCTVGPREDPS